MDEDQYGLDAINAAFDAIAQTTRDLNTRMKQMQVELARVEALSGHDGYVIHEEKELT